MKVKKTFRQSFILILVALVAVVFFWQLPNLSIVLSLYGLTKDTTSYTITLAIFAILILSAGYLLLRRTRYV